MTVNAVLEGLTFSEREYLIENPAASWRSTRGVPHDGRAEVVRGPRCPNRLFTERGATARTSLTQWRQDIGAEGV